MKHKANILRRVLASMAPHWRGATPTVVTADQVGTGTRLKTMHEYALTTYDLPGNGLSGAIFHADLAGALVGLKGEVELKGDKLGWTLTSGLLTHRLTPAGVTPTGREWAEWDDAATASETVTLPLAGVEYVLAATSRDLARPILTSVLLDETGLVATDSYRLHLAPIANGLSARLLDATSLKRACKIARADKHDTLTLTTGTDPSGKTLTRVIAGGVASFAAPTVAGDVFPAYRELIPDMGTLTLVSVDASGLRQVLGNAPKGARVVLTINNNNGPESQYLAASIEGGETTSPVDLGVAMLPACIGPACPAAPAPVRLSAAYLADALVSLERVSIGFSGLERKPLPVGEAGRAASALVMPIAG